MRFTPFSGVSSNFQAIYVLVLLTNFDENYFYRKSLFENYRNPRQTPELPLKRLIYTCFDVFLKLEVAYFFVFDIQWSNNHNDQVLWISSGDGLLKFRRVASPRPWFCGPEMGLVKNWLGFIM